MLFLDDMHDHVGRPCRQGTTLALPYLVYTTASMLAQSVLCISCTSLIVGNRQNTVSRVLFRMRELTEFCGKRGEFCENLGEFALAHK